MPTTAIYRSRSRFSPFGLHDKTVVVESHVVVVREFYRSTAPRKWTPEV